MDAAFREVQDDKIKGRRWHMQTADLNFPLEQEMRFMPFATAEHRSG
jgi:hypothetical protein